MPAQHDGTVAFDPVLGSVVVEFKRDLPQPPHAVWDHLVDRNHLNEWLTSEPGGHIRHRVGGEVFLPTIGGAVIDSEVDVYQPPRILAFAWVTLDWVGGEVEWALDPADGGGTLLDFGHAYLDEGADHMARTLANWHHTLDRFEASLSGTPVPWDFAAWEAHFHRYGQRMIAQWGLTDEPSGPWG
jgi:uncharacterized protein YndB with AHSA1/START domain